ncbi:TylF/MycF family methyltransferase [Reichenbachiella agarivorans]|uniref:TylF/MycF family methyltransferase n=1 Tax=Reichenbachiella agarivorans TaxID=2979464 RepID=A0ABY6CMT2_9BACT|nr:TylF/MycF family methyltransferase [Reichenbachiella agarivorans]UXP31064.1 TylF/MycF family methyltransferase [Reichenbachiella agarivorans]
MKNPFVQKIKESFQLLSNMDGWKIIKLKLTYLRIGALNNLRDAVIQLDKKNIPGLFIETGCALGGSTIQIGLVKQKERKFKAYDVFGMIPPPSERDDQDIIERFDTIKEGKSKGIRGDEYYGYKKDLKQVVVNNLATFGLSPDQDNIELVEGLYENTLRINEPVAFAHIDCDWYDSVMTCLNQIVPHLVPQGILVIDDYYDWSGCRKAIDDYFRDKKSDFTFAEKNSKLIITKNS